MGKCAVDVPDAACHWYVAAPDNTFGKGFSWKDAPWFDANGLKDVAKNSKKYCIRKSTETKYLGNIIICNTSYPIFALLCCVILCSIKNNYSSLFGRDFLFNSICI